METHDIYRHRLHSSHLYLLLEDESEQFLLCPYIEGVSTGRFSPVCGRYSPAPTRAPARSRLVSHISPMCTPPPYCSRDIGQKGQAPRLLWWTRGVDGGASIGRLPQSPGRREMLTLWKCYNPSSAKFSKLCAGSKRAKRLRNVPCTFWNLRCKVETKLKKRLRLDHVPILMFGGSV